MSLPEGWRASVPVVHIPRHPLWIDAYAGAWDLLEQWAAQPGAARQPETAAILHYARYAFAALPLADWLDQQYEARLSPLHAWSEWSLYQVAGDTARLTRALPVLLEQYSRLRATRRRPNPVTSEKHRTPARSPERVVDELDERSGGTGRSATAGGQAGGTPPPELRQVQRSGPPCLRREAACRQADGLYYHPEGECDMDHSPRAPYGWVDLSAQQAMAAECIASIARAVGDLREAAAYETERQSLSNLIDRSCWNSSRQFYADCGEDGAPQAIKTVAGLWPLLAGVPSLERAERLAAHLSEPEEFWRVHVFAELSADHPRYSDRGNRGRGAIWPFDNYAIIKGLERYGLHDLARRAADNHLTTISHVYKETRSHWDHYAPDYIEPAGTASHAAAGTGVSAVALLLETILGLSPDAPAHTLHWRPTLHEAYSVEGLRIGSTSVSLRVTPDLGAPGRLQATLLASQPLRLHVISSEGEQWVDVHDEIALSVTNQATSL